MFSNNLLMAAASASGGDAYSVGNSVRFNDNNSAYMSRTPTSAGNRDVWTLSVWVKLADWDTTSKILHAGDSYDFTHIYFSHATATDSNLEIVQKTSAAYDFDIYSTMQLRDPTSWYHILVKYDSGADSGSRILAWVNNVAVSWTQRLSRGTEPSSGLDSHVNNTVAHYIGRANTAADYWDGYMSQFTLIDGTAYDTTDFGELDNEGEWRPKNVTALTFGTNGFLQDYAVAPGTDDGAGTDVSGNDNHFASSGLAANDQVTDSPTNNYCTIASNSEPLHAGTGVWTVANGNTEAGLASGTGDMHYRTTMQVSEGEWYWEDTVGTQGAWGDMFGILEINTGGLYSVHNYNGSLNADTTTNSTSGGAQGYGSGLSSGDTVCNHLDLESGEYSMRVNGGSWREQLTGMSGAWSPMIGMNNQTASFQGNWGTSPRGSGGNADDNGYGDFDYAPPTNALSLCTANMTALDFDPAEHHQVELVNHDGSSTAFTLGWNADTYDTLFIIKNRDSTEAFHWIDGVRGYNKYFTSETTSAWTTDSNVISVSGTTITLGSTLAADNYVIECHRGGASASRTSHTADVPPDLASTTSFNSVTGFCIMTWTGGGTLGQTINHGMGQAPDLFISSQDNASQNKRVYHSSVGATKYLNLEADHITATSSNFMNDTEPTASVISLGATGFSNNDSGASHVGYAWAAVEGYSAFGSYSGNGNALGPVINAGVSPSSTLLKKIAGAVNNWTYIHEARDTYNASANGLRPDLTNAEQGSASGQDTDQLSTGMKIRNANNQMNTSGTDNYIYSMWGTPTVNKSETPAKAR